VLCERLPVSIFAEVFGYLDVYLEVHLVALPCPIFFELVLLAMMIHRGLQIEVDLPVALPAPIGDRRAHSEEIAECIPSII
jgi:hypothetical protein